MRPLHIVSVEARAWTLPLVAPFVIATRTATEAQNVQVRVRTDADIEGLGAAAPVGYVTGESVGSVLEALGAVGPCFAGRPVEHLEPLLNLAGNALADAPAARAGLEMALYDLWAKQRGLPLWRHFGGAETRVFTDLTVPMVAPAEAAARAASAWADGFRALKLKVGDPSGTEADLARIEAVVQAAPAARLRIDANQAFEPVEAVKFAHALRAMGAKVELLEQPVARENLAGLRYVRAHAGVPVFADESACTTADVQRLLDADAVDGINLKLMKSGLVGTLQSIALCRAAGKPLMLGCMLESGLGIAAAAQIAAGTGAFAYLDLDSHRLLRPVEGLTGGFSVDGDALVVGDQIAGDQTESGWGVTLPLPADTGNNSPC